MICFSPAITHNRTALSYPGMQVEFSWEAPGSVVGPYNQTTKVGAQVNLTNITSSDLYVGWISQLVSRLQQSATHCNSI